MGEFAEATIWAALRGKEMYDLSPDEWGQFYSEYDAPKPKGVSPSRCPICNRRCGGRRGVRDHANAVHLKHGQKRAAEHAKRMAEWEAAHG